MPGAVSAHLAPLGQDAVGSRSGTVCEPLSESWALCVSPVRELGTVCEPCLRVYQRLQVSRPYKRIVIGPEQPIALEPCHPFVRFRQDERGHPVLRKLIRFAAVTASSGATAACWNGAGR